jgi:hypothetical protein
MKECNIHDYLIEFTPYFVSLRIIDSYLIIDVEIPTNWDAGKLTQELVEGAKTIQTLLTGQDKDSNIKIISIVGCNKFHTFDNIFDRLEKVIKVNREREEKNKLFKVMVKKLEKVFIDSDLNNLQNLIIDIPTNGESIDNIEVGNADNAQLPASEEEITETLDLKENVNKNSDVVTPN